MNIPPNTSSVYPPYQGNRYTGLDTGIRTAYSQESSVRSDKGVASEDSTIEEANGSAKTKTASESRIETSQLTPEELRLVEQLKQTDLKVRQHEMAHLNAGGAYITSGATFTYKQGPDGQKYAVGGEVGIDVSPVPGDPQATLRKMRQVRNAAIAPADPSGQDLKVAANASSQSLKALSELTLLQAKERAGQQENQAFGPNRKEAAESYTRVNNLPETETSTFQLAV